ncbi:MAG: signal peptidase I [bacterium]
MKKILGFIWETIKIVVTALVIVVPIRYFLFQPFFVKGQSMEPSFETGDYLIIDEISYRFREPQRGDIIVFKFPKNPTQRYIKRIIGLPGETVAIEDGKIIVYKGEKAELLDESKYLSQLENTTALNENFRETLGEDEYFVLGDNRAVSYDSRRWGAVPGENIIGRVVLRAWPFTVFAGTE